MSILRGERFARAFVYWTGLINTFWGLFYGAVIYFIRMTAIYPNLGGLFVILMFPLSLLLWYKVVQRNKYAVYTQIAILVTIAVGSFLITVLMPLLYMPCWVYVEWSSFYSMIIITLSFIWFFFLFLGVAPSFIVIPTLFASKIISLNEYYSCMYYYLVEGPLTLTISIIFLKIIIMYWRRYE